MKNKSSTLTLLLVLGLTPDNLAHVDSKSEAGKSGTGKASSSESGVTYYERLCSGCHGSDGLALSGEAPPLAGSSWVTGPEERLIRIIVHGMKGPVQVADKTYDREMPGVGRKLSDREIALLVSFVRSHWGASHVSTTPETVKRVRAASKNRTRYWTAEELLSTP